MTTKTDILKVTYTYKVNYGHKDHLCDIKRDLEKAPLNETRGAGVASDGKAYHFSCKLTGKGVICQ